MGIDCCKQTSEADFYDQKRIGGIEDSNNKVQTYNLTTKEQQFVCQQNILAEDISPINKNYNPLNDTPSEKKIFESPNNYEEQKRNKKQIEYEIHELQPQDVNDQVIKEQRNQGEIYQKNKQYNTPKKEEFQEPVEFNFKIKNETDIQKEIKEVDDEYQEIFNNSNEIVNDQQNGQENEIQKPIEKFFHQEVSSNIMETEQNQKSKQTENNIPETSDLNKGFYIQQSSQQGSSNHEQEKNETGKDKSKEEVGSLLHEFCSDKEQLQFNEI